MGILNATPDSCFDKSRCFSPEKAIERAYEMVHSGADILDIGAESTRPGAEPVSSEEEKNRLRPIFDLLGRDFPLPISIDTYKPEVAEFALRRGVCMINDITGFSHPAMQDLAKEYAVDICVMHMQGMPQTMQDNPSYPEGIIPHLLQFFEKRIEELMKKGVSLHQIILDPGIGFGKTVAHNLEIYRNIHVLKKYFGLRLLLGGSRKSFMGRIVQKTYPDLLTATLVMHSIAAIQGVDIFRVHDVSQHKDLSLLTHSFLNLT